MRIRGKKGIELEAWVRDLAALDMCAADSDAIVAALKGKTIDKTKVEREPGEGSVELISDARETLRASVEDIVYLAGMVQDCGVEIITQMQTPFASPVREFLPGTRYATLWEAAHREAQQCGCGESWSRMMWMYRCAALQGHWSFDGYRIGYDTVDERIIFWMNVLNFIAPRAANILCKKHGIFSKGHRGIWHGWAHPGRFSQPDDWFDSFAAYRRHFESLKRLIAKGGGGKFDAEYRVDLANHLDWENPDDHGAGVWPFVRLRPSYGTGEVRLLTSCPLDVLEPIMEDLDALVCFVLDLAEDGAGIPTQAAFRASSVWRRLTEFPVGGVECVPFDYGKSLWLADVDREALQPVFESV